MPKTLKTAIALVAGLGLGFEAAGDDKDKPAVPVISNAPMVKPELSPSTPRNTVRWTTNRLNNYGYDVFRAESESGPFEKLNDQLVPGGSNGADRNEFSYVDANIDPHKAYWYYVESIDLMGKRRKFTPTIKAEPKLPAEPAPSANPR